MDAITEKLLTEVKLRISDAQNIFKDTKNFPTEKIIELSIAILQCFRKGGKIAFVGNGGSAAEAIHIAAEFTGKCVKEHIPLPALCLNESQSAITAIANDYGVEKMFSRLVDAHLKSGDILIALSTSGNSKNIIEAISAALAKNVNTILWTGQNASDSTKYDVWKVESSSTPRVQEVHLVWGHVIAEIVESNLDLFRL